MPDASERGIKNDSALHYRLHVARALASYPRYPPPDSREQVAIEVKERRTRTEGENTKGRNSHQQRCKQVRREREKEIARERGRQQEVQG